MEFGEKIKALRIKQGLTLEEVGNIVGVGKSTVRKWECGQIANMRRDKIALLAKALKVTPGYLMGWSDDPDAPKEETREGQTSQVQKSKSVDSDEYDVTLKESTSELRAKMREHRELRTRFQHTTEVSNLAQTLLGRLGMKDAAVSDGTSRTTSSTTSASYASSMTSTSYRSEAAQLVAERYDSLDEYGKRAVEAVLAVELSRMQGVHITTEGDKIVFEIPDSSCWR